MPTDNKLLAAKEQALANYCQRLHGKNHKEQPVLARNVVGIGIGQRIKGGQPVDEQCVRFYLDHKIKPREAVPPDELIEEGFGDVKTDVIAVRHFASFDPGPRPGSSFGLHYSAPNVEPSLVGTLSAFVQFGTTYYVLGSNHVMAVNGRVPPGTRMIFRPDRQFVDDPDTNIFARTTVHVPFSHEKVNHFDCALAEVEEQKRVESEFARFPDHIIIDSANLKDPEYGKKVVRVDQTEQPAPAGTIVDVDARMRIDFSFGTFEFENLILIEGDGKPFANPGDSGALVIDKSSNEATALVIGGNGSYTVACPLSKALEKLGNALAQVKKTVLAAPKIKLVVPPRRKAGIAGSSVSGD